MALLRAKIRGTCWICFSKIKTPFFSSDKKGKTKFLGAIVRMQAQMYVGPWVLSKEVWWTENKSIVRKE